MVYNNGFGVKIITDTDQDKLRRESYNYVALKNNTEYRVQLLNDRSTDAMAEVYIEGDSVGTWLIPSKESITIDRPANIARKFTFFKETDSRAIGAGVIPGKSLNGIIRVIFYPKKQYISISSSISKVVYPRVNTPSVSSFQNSGVISPAVSSFQNFDVRSPTQSIISSPQASTSSYSNIMSSGMYPKSPPRSPSYQSGATVLGAQSSQTFGSTKRFTDNEIDWENKTEIIIRLIVKPTDNLVISTAESKSGNMWERQFISIKDNTQSIPPRIDDYLPLI